MDSQTLLAQLRDLGLAPTDRAAQYDLTQLAARLPDARPFTKELIDRNLLTPYQANQLLTGKGASLAVGPYRILQRLGEGGTAQVFKARHQLLRRMAALKIIHSDRVANPVAVERFLREAQAAAALEHPNIVRAYDVGTVGDGYYFAMEFLDGIDLARLVKTEGKLPVDRACYYVWQAARGLQHIHESGMVHRDIKPSNLMLVLNEPGRGSVSSGTASHSGVTPRRSPDLVPLNAHQVKILDLGLARLSEDPSAPQQAVLTKVGAVMGTPDYMAPEQAMHSRNADIRSDIYSLGCTFYFLLAGSPPFPGGEPLEKMFRHQLDAPEPIDALRPDVPPGLKAILERMMAKKPEERFQQPKDVLQAIQDFCHSQSADLPLHELDFFPAFLRRGDGAADADHAAQFAFDEPEAAPYIVRPKKDLRRIFAEQRSLLILAGCAAAVMLVAALIALLALLR